jgi:hypothetical protein
MAATFSGGDGRNGDLEERAGPGGGNDHEELALLGSSRLGNQQGESAGESACERGRTTLLEVFLNSIQRIHKPCGTARIEPAEAVFVPPADMIALFFDGTRKTKEDPGWEFLGAPASPIVGSRFLDSLSALTDQRCEVRGDSVHYSLAHAKERAEKLRGPAGRRRPDEEPVSEIMREFKLRFFMTQGGEDMVDPFLTLGALRAASQHLVAPMESAVATSADGDKVILFAIPDGEIGTVLDELELERERAFAYRQAQQKVWWHVTNERMALMYTASKLVVIPILLGVWGWHAVAQTRTFPHVSLGSNTTATLVFDNAACAASEFCNATCTAREFCAAPGLRYYFNGTLQDDTSDGMGAQTTDQRLGQISLLSLLRAGNLTSDRLTGMTRAEIVAKVSGSLADAIGGAVYKSVQPAGGMVRTHNCTIVPGLTTSWWQLPIGAVTFACLRDAHAAAGVATLANTFLALYAGFVVLVLAWIGAGIAFMRGTVHERERERDPTRNGVHFWKQCTNEAGAKFYYNSATRASVWEEPRELRAARVAAQNATRGAYVTGVSRYFPENHHEGIRRRAQEDPSAVAVVDVLLQLFAERPERPAIFAVLLFWLWLWAVAKFADALANISGCKQPWCRAVRGVFGTQALAHACPQHAFALPVVTFVALNLCALSAVATAWLTAAWLMRHALHSH